MSRISKFFSTSRPVGLGLLVELLTNGAEHHAGILAHARDLAFGAFAVASWSRLLPIAFQFVACDTIHVIHQCMLIKRPHILSLVFREHPFLPAPPLQTFR